MGGDGDILPSSDASELIDFTCASPWERLALDIELQLRSWAVHDGQQASKPDELKHSSTYGDMNASAFDPKPLMRSPLSIGEKTLFLELRKSPPNDSLHTYPLERVLGLHTSVLLTADTPDGIAADDGSEGAVLLSAMTVAASSCACAIPMIVPVGRPASLRFIGRQLHPYHLRFSCDYIPQIPEEFTHLAGLLNLFRNKRIAAKRLSPPRLNDAIIAAKFTYEWIDFSFRLTPTPGSFASERRLNAIQSIALAESDPVRRIRVTAIWNDFPASALQQRSVLVGMPASTAARLRLSPANDLIESIASGQVPLPRIPLTAPALANLRLAQKAAISRHRKNPAAPIPVIDVRKCISTQSVAEPAPDNDVSLMERSPVASRINTVDEPRSPRIARSPGPSALDDFLIQVGEYVAAAAIQDDRIDEQFLSSAVAALFEMDLGRGIMADVVEALGPNAAETTVLERVARLMAASETMNGAQKLWSLFLDGVEVHWEHEWIICGVPFSAEDGPDHDESLIVQKLQMINCCVERRRREAAGLNVRMPGSHSDPMGRKALLEGVELIGKGNYTSGEVEDGVRQVWEPFVQPHQLVTRDMVEEELQRMVRRAESNNGNDDFEAKRQSITLKSDMMSFKAANPDSGLADFVRWFSPSDWVEKDDQEESGKNVDSHTDKMADVEPKETSEEMPEEAIQQHGSSHDSNKRVSGRRGRLSARMSRKGNIWEELWEAAEGLPASRQVPIFDAAAHGSKALADLRAMPMTQVLLHMGSILGSGATILLQRAFSRTPDLPSVRNRIDRAKNAMREINSTLQLDLASSAELGRVAEALDHVASTEHSALIATSVFTKLPPVDGLGHVVDKLACAECADVVQEQERELITRMAGLDDGGWRSVLLPEVREFVIRGVDGEVEDKSLTDRMYAQLSRDEFRVGFRLGVDYSV